MLACMFATRQQLETNFAIMVLQSIQQLYHRTKGDTVAFVESDQWCNSQPLANFPEKLCVRTIIYS